MLEPEDTAGCSWQKSRQTGTTLAYVYISTQSSVAKVSGKGFHGHLGKYWNALNSRSLEFCWVTAQRPRLAPCGREPQPALQPWPRAPWRPAPSLRLPAPGRQRPWGVYVGAALLTQKTLPLRQWAEQHVLSETPFPSGSTAKLRVCVCCACGPRSGVALTLRVCSQVLIYFSSCFTNWIMSVGLFQNIDFFGYYMNIQIILFTLSVFSLEMVHFVLSDSCAQNGLNFLLCFNICGIYSDISPFILHTGILYLFSFHCFSVSLEPYHFKTLLKEPSFVSLMICMLFLFSVWWIYAPTFFFRSEDCYAFCTDQSFYP